MSRWKPSSVNGLAWLFGLTGVWCWVFRHLAVEWRLNEDYSYGFCVPVLAAVLAWQRLSDGFEQSFQTPSKTRSVHVALMAAAGVTFLLGELLRLQDPTWRFAGWLLVLAATCLTVSWLHRLGGAGFVSRFLLPVGFLWLSLPWPSSLETPVILTLLKAASTLSVDILNWLAVPALQQGNMIVLKQGVIGVDRACSGIQSLQASLMISIFAGEWFRLSRPRRLSLILSGVFLSFVLNMARVFILVLAAHRNGLEGMEARHDQIGFAATMALSGWLVLAGWLLRSKQTQTTPASGSISRFDWHLEGFDGGIVLAIAILVPCVSWGWMTRGSGSTGDQALWILNTSKLPAGWKASEGKFAPEELKLLRFSQGQVLNLVDPTDRKAQVVHLFWRPSEAVPSLAYNHRPDICMPGAGWSQAGSAKPMDLRIAGKIIPGAIYSFKHEFAHATVFHAMWFGGQAKPSTGPASGGSSRFGRLALLWKEPGRRNHEILTVFVQGDVLKEDRTRVFEEILRTVLSPASTQ